MPQPKPVEQLSGLVCVLHTLVQDVLGQDAFMLGGGEGQHTSLLQHAVEHDVPSHLHWAPTQCWPGVEQVPILSVQVPPAPLAVPHEFAALQLGVLHAPR